MSANRQVVAISGEERPHRANARELRAPDPAHIGIGANPPPEPGFIDLFYAIESRRRPEEGDTTERPLVLQLIAASENAGASTVAAGYARVAADDSARPVLLVDCTGRTHGTYPSAAELPPLVEVLRRGRPLTDAAALVKDTRNLFWARLGAGPRPLMTMGSDRMRVLLDGLREIYGIIVLDTPHAGHPEAAAAARHCNGSVLIVAARSTRHEDIVAAKRKIHEFGGQTIGLVFNRERRLLSWWQRRRS